MVCMLLGCLSLAYCMLLVLGCTTRVQMPNGLHATIVGIGDFVLENDRVLRDVLYLPDFYI